MNNIIISLILAGCSAILIGLGVITIFCEEIPIFVSGCLGIIGLFTSLAACILEASE